MVRPLEGATELRTADHSHLGTTHRAQDRGAVSGAVSSFLAYTRAAKDAPHGEGTVV